MEEEYGLQNAIWVKAVDTRPADRLPSTSSSNMTSTPREASALPSKPGGFVTER